ncbi:MAG: hypothetical protein ACHQJ6_00745 [Candidatus Berkiellales bacterium]
MRRFTPGADYRLGKSEQSSSEKSSSIPDQILLPGKLNAIYAAHLTVLESAERDHSARQRLK